jgi:hypothetical protein
MAAQGPGEAGGTHPAPEGTPPQTQPARFDVTEIVEAGTTAPPPYPQPNNNAQPQPAPSYAPQPYPQPPHPQPVMYPQTPHAETAYPQAAYDNWGVPTASTLPPPQPKLLLPRKTVIGACALVATSVLVLALGVATAAPPGGPTAKRTTGVAAQDQAVRAVWRTAAVQQLLPSAIKREGTETYIRLGINPNESCGQLPAAFSTDLAPGACARVLAATYVDRTQTVTATIGIVVISGTAADRIKLFQSWTPDSNSNNAAMMPHAYAVPGTVAAHYTDSQRVAWQSQDSADGTYLVYAVTGFTDGRGGPVPAAIAAGSGSALSSSSPAVQVAGDLPAAIQDLLSAQNHGGEDGAS